MLRKAITYDGCGAENQKKTNKQNDWNNVSNYLNSVLEKAEKTNPITGTGAGCSSSRNLKNHGRTYLEEFLEALK